MKIFEHKECLGTKLLYGLGPKLSNAHVWAISHVNLHVNEHDMTYVWKPLGIYVPSHMDQALAK